MKKRFYKRPLFWIVAVILIIIVASAGNDNKTVSTTPNESHLKHSYSDFYAWLTAERQDAMLKDIGNTYQIITSRCQGVDSNFGPTWVACMQEGYKDYLKPDTFTNDNWQGDYTTMVGDINDAVAQKSQYGAKSETDQYKKDMQEAQTIYERLAV